MIIFHINGYIQYRIVQCTQVLESLASFDSYVLHPTIMMTLLHGIAILSTGHLLGESTGHR